MALTKIPASLIDTSSGINGLIYPSSDGTTGQFLKTDGSGNLSFATVDTSIAANSIGITEINVLDGTNGQVLTTDGSGTLSFADGGVTGIVSSADATAITIDSDENILIGTNTLDAWYTSTNAGVNITNASNFIAVARSGGVPFIANRLSSDGDIMEFKKDGGAIGTIGTGYGQLYIGTGDTALYFDSTDETIVPFNASTNSQRANAINLGRSAAPFKDLYLSGGVVFDVVAGNATSNTLDDYEEGTFTVGFTGASISAGNTTGHYTKIGRVVYYSYYSTAATISNASGVAELTGLPFTVKSGVTYYQPFYTAHNTFFGNSTSIGVEGYPNVNATSLRFIERGTTNNSTFVNGVSKYLMVAGFYITDA